MQFGRDLGVTGSLSMVEYQLGSLKDTERSECGDYAGGEELRDRWAAKCMSM